MNGLFYDKHNDLQCRRVNSTKLPFIHDFSEIKQTNQVVNIKSVCFTLFYTVFYTNTGHFKEGEDEVSWVSNQQLLVYASALIISTISPSLLHYSQKPSVFWQTELVRLCSHCASLSSVCIGVQSQLISASTLFLEDNIG